MELGRAGETAVLTLSGRGRTSDADRLYALVEEVVEGGATGVVVDLSGVEFFGSYGVNALIRLDRAMRERGGAVRLVAPGPAIVDLLAKASLDEKFEVYPTTEAALG